MKVLVWHSIEFIREECLVMKLNRRDGPVVKSLECHVKCYKIYLMIKRIANPKCLIQIRILNIFITSGDKEKR